MGKGKKKVSRKTIPACLEGFAALCTEGWLQGWHERNGGNLSYRLTACDRAAMMAWAPFVDAVPQPWVPLPHPEPELAGAWLLVTGSGRHMRLVAQQLATHVGLIELDEQGAAWRVLWGLEDGGRPTSELPTHLVAHGVRMAATQGAARVVYHAHTPNLIALSYALPAEDRAVTRVLWKTLPECVMTVPEGVGVVGWGVPGSQELAEATRAKMGEYAAVLWALHGLFCTGETFDETLGLAHTLEKAAQIHRYARQMNNGSDMFWQTIPDEGLRAAAEAAGVVANERFLNEPPRERVCGFVGPQ